MATASAGVAIPKELTGRTNLIAGDWVEARSGERFEVRSPATGELLAEVPSCAPADVDAASAAAKAAWPAFKARHVYERAAIVLRMAELVRERAKTIARVLSAEQGKPYETESLPEVMEVALNFQLAGEDVVRMETPVLAMRTTSSP